MITETDEIVKMKAQYRVIQQEQLMDIARRVVKRFEGKSEKHELRLITLVYSNQSGIEENIGGFTIQPNNPTVVGSFIIENYNRGDGIESVTRILQDVYERTIKEYEYANFVDFRILSDVVGENQSFYDYYMINGSLI